MRKNTLSVVIPYHRQLHFKDIVNILYPFTDWIKEIHFCHNGPIDSSKFEKIEADGFNLMFHHTQAPGLGAGCRMGIANSQSDFILITGSDLPFGVSDLVTWIKLQEINDLPDLVIGSKFHPQSIIKNRHIIRTCLSYSFRFFKKILIPLVLPDDTQGTIFIKRDICLKALPKCNSNGFFFTTELITWSIKEGAQFEEIPISYYEKNSKSSVSPIKDSIKFLFGLFLLKLRTTRSNYRV